MNCPPCRLLVGALVGVTISAGPAALACDPVPACEPAAACDEKPTAKRTVIKLESMGDLAELDLTELGADVEFIFEDEDGAHKVMPKGKTFQWRSSEGGNADGCCVIDISAMGKPVMVAPGRYAVIGDDAGRFQRVQDFTVAGPRGNRLLLGDGGAMRGVTLGRVPGGQGNAFTYAIAMGDDHGEGESESHTVEVRIENGKVTATVDGKEVDTDRVSVDGGRIVIRDKDGKVMDLDGMMKHMKQMRVNVPENMGKWMHEFKVDDRFLRDGTLNRLRDAPDDFTFEERVAPHVVIGVELSEPDEAVLRHLGLGGEVSEIVAVTEGFGAEKAGLKPLDIIVEVEGADGADAESIREAISGRDEGDTIEVVVIREGKRKSYEVQLKKWQPQEEDFQFGPGEGGAFEWKFDDGGNVFFGGPDGEGGEEGMRRFRLGVGGEEGEGGQFFVLPKGVDADRWFSAPGAPKGPGLEDRVNRLERRLDELADRLERLLDKLDR